MSGAEVGSLSFSRKDLRAGLPWVDEVEARSVWVRFNGVPSIPLSRSAEEGEEARAPLEWDPEMEEMEMDSGGGTLPLPFPLPVVVAAIPSSPLTFAFSVGNKGLSVSLSSNKKSYPLEAEDSFRRGGLDILLWVREREREREKEGERERKEKVEVNVSKMPRPSCSAKRLARPRGFSSPSHSPKDHFN